MAVMLATSCAFSADRGAGAETSKSSAAPARAGFSHTAHTGHSHRLVFTVSPTCAECCVSHALSVPVPVPGRAFGALRKLIRRID